MQRRVGAARGVAPSSGEEDSAVLVTLLGEKVLVSPIYQVETVGWRVLLAGTSSSNR